MTPADHKDCPGSLRANAARKGLDITVSTAPPLVAGPYTTKSLICPHGTIYWFEPTGEQIAEWVREGVA